MVKNYLNSNIASQYRSCGKNPQSSYENTLCL
jgi:hypothetical protein